MDVGWSAERWSVAVSAMTTDTEERHAGAGAQMHRGLGVRLLLTLLIGSLTWQAARAVFIRLLDGVGVRTAGASHPCFINAAT